MVTRRNKNFKKSEDLFLSTTFLGKRKMKLATQQWIDLIKNPKRREKFQRSTYFSSTMSVFVIKSQCSNRYFLFRALLHLDVKIRFIMNR